MIIERLDAVLHCLEERPSLGARQGKAENACDRRSDVHVPRRKRVPETAAEIRPGRGQRVVHVPRAEAAVHAPVIVALEHSRVLGARNPLDARPRVEIVAEEDVGIAPRRVLRVDRAQRQSAGHPAVAVVDENRPHFAPRLQERDRPAHDRRVVIRDVDVVAASVHRDDQRARPKRGRYLHRTDLVLLSRLSADAPVLIRQGRIDRPAVRLDPGGDRLIRAADPVVRLEPRAAQQVRYADEPGHGMPAGRIDVAHLAVA